MKTHTQCGFCNQPATYREGATWKEFNCSYCGIYKITDSAYADMQIDKERFLENARQIAGWIRQQNKYSNIPEIKSDKLEYLLKLSLPPFADRANELLRFYAARIKTLGQPAIFKEIEARRASYSLEKEEYNFIDEYLAERRLIKYIGIGPQVTPEGYAALERLDKAGANLEQGFVAMWFDESLENAYFNGIDPGVVAAGYRPHRVDQREHVEKIDDEIVRQIRRSRFVVADFSGHRGGVYFEAGFAMGLGLPVIWTCRHDHLQGLHFDIRQYNVLVWETPSEIKEKLSRRIEAVIGKGPFVPKLNLK